MSKSLSKVVVGAVLLGSAVAAQAGTEVGRWTGGVGGMWTQTDTDRRVDDGFGFSYEAGYALNEQWDVTVHTFSGNHDDLAPGATWDRELKGLMLDFGRVFNRSARISPFILIGAGLLDQHRPDPDLPLRKQDKEIAVKLGGGALADLANVGPTKVQLKGTLAARSSVGRNIIDVVATLGVQVAFGGGSK
jgi:hypothetical protein